MVQSWPKWAQRHVVLGLDLQGGSHILLEVDSNAVRKEKLETLRDDVRRVLRDARVGYTGLVVRGNSVEVRIREGSNFDQALQKLRELSQPLGGILGSSTGQRSLDVTTEAGNLVRLTVTEPALVERVRQSVEQSIQIIERRVNELGTVEPLIQRQGVDRILVQVPGLQDPTRLKELLGKTAKLDFRMVDVSMPAEQAAQGRVPPDDEILYSTTQPKTPYLVEKRILVSGGDLTDAQPGFDQRTNEPIVSFRFNTSGARKFAQVTQENVGKPFAIILDNQVISAPVIREPILGGSGQISGSFTVESANDLAILLRAGALPAPLTIIEERTVGPGLGQDFDRQRQGFVLCRRGDGDRFYACDLRALWTVRQPRGGHQRGHDLRRAVIAQRDAHVAGHRRYRAHGRHRGQLKRADLRAYPRRGAWRPNADQRHRCRIFTRARHHSRFQHHDIHCGRGAVLYRHRSRARFCRYARHWNYHDRLHRLYPDTADRRLLGALAAPATRSNIGARVVRLLRIVPDDTKFDFMRFRRISFPISALLSILAISLYFFHGLNFGIDFKGGTLIEVQSKAGAADLAKMRAALGTLGLGEVQLQQFGAPNDVLIRIAEQPGGEVAQQQAVSKVRGALGNEVDYRRVEVVGPRVSGELLSYGVVGLMLAIVAILIYLWFRFEWQFALGAMIANVHDIVLTIGFMSITQIDFDLTSIAALLTILGYSLNDTVVIYDRIREMLRRYRKLPMPELLNASVNQTLSRSVITHVTVSLALLALLLFGGQAIHSFTATMMFGVVLVGTYTSVFIASPILIYLGVGTGRDSLTASDRK